MRRVEVRRVARVPESREYGRKLFAGFPQLVVEKNSLQLVGGTLELNLKLFRGKPGFTCTNTWLKACLSYLNVGKQTASEC